MPNGADWDNYPTHMKEHFSGFPNHVKQLLGDYVRGT